VVRVSHPTLTGYAVVVGDANSSIGGPTNADSGAVLVSGTGALLDGDGAGIAVGLLSDGSLVISKGGSVVSGTPNDSTFAAVAIGRQGTGSITITDPGSSAAVLSIGTLSGFAATIGSFGANDDIIIQGTLIATTTYDTSTHILTLLNASDATIGTLQFGDTVSGQYLVADGAGGIGTAPCFVAGTRISTQRGEIAVETMQLGDQVQMVNAKGAQPVVWVGHRSLDCTRHPQPRKVWPVRIKAHAFGLNRPYRDLWLSPDHAVYAGDVLVPVKYLINASTISQIAMDEVKYYHVELPRHGVLLAEGLAVESYLDTGDRVNFTNGSGPIALYPDFASRVWEAEGCAPLVVTGPALEAARRWVNGLAACATLAA
jgi:collagen type I/II/III/V/XI/XXIV/XXVII alpha